MADHLLIVTFEIFYLIHTIFMYNLDVSAPIIYADPKSGGDGAEVRNSYFGYSLLLSPGNKPREKPWILIGAPRANDSTFPNIKEPGVVYRCNIFENCTQFIVDTTGNERRQLQPRESYMDRKDGAWIGGAMDINFASNPSGKVAVCGHRWQNQRPPGYNRDYHIEGVCYVVSPNNDTQKLIPLLSAEKAALDNAIYYYAHGQAGISVHFPQTDYGEEMLLGAPGVFNWQGTTILYKEIVELQRFGNALIPNPIFDTTSKYFYLQGYQVTSGRFFSRQKLVYVTGAPRALDCKGQVVLFEYSTNQQEVAFAKQIVQKGEQMGEYFGAALAVADVNGDNLDDLIVGSPLYDTDWEEGRVHVFLGSHRGSLSIPENGAVLVGQKPGGRFGTALASLHDLDLDGFDDIAIGAPYEDDHRGVVYIFNGRSRGLKETPSQIIKASDLYSELRGFGISFGKSIDIDENNFNDVGIGSYLSGHAVILRSKPVIFFNSSLTSSVSRLERKVDKFSIETCVSFAGPFAPKKIRAQRVVEVDLELLRIKIGEKTTENGVYSKNVTLTNGVVLCESIKLNIEKKIMQYLTGIPIVLSLELVQIEPELAVNLIDGKKRLGNDNFCSSCVRVNERLSKKISRLEVPFALDCGDDNVCIADLKVHVTSNLIEYVIGSSSPIRLFINVTNTGEAAYMSTLMVVVPTDVNFRTQPENCEIFSASIECLIGNPLAKNEHIQVVLDLELANPSGLMFSENLESLKLIVSTMSKSDEADWADNSINVQIPLKTEASIALAGKTSSDVYSYQIDEKDKNPFNISFDHLFEVQKLGASPVDEVLLEVFIPSVWNESIDQESFEIVKIVGVETKHGSQSFLCSIGQLNETTFSIANFTQAQDVLPPENRTLFLNCSSDVVLCRKIECIVGPIRSVQENVATLQIVMELNVKLIGEKLLGKKDIIYLTSAGSVMIKSPKILKDNSFMQFTMVSTSFNAGFQNVPVEWWIVILSAVVGLLILSLVISGFAKAGFFKRKKKEELLIQKQMMAENHEDDIAENL